MYQAKSSSSSKLRRSGINNQTWLSQRLIDAARLLLVSAIFAAVWGLGGHTPDARFVVLAFVTAAGTLALFGAADSNAQLRPMLPMLLVIFSIIFYGLLQIAPISFGGTLEWTGVRELQSQFGAMPTGESAESQALLTQSLVPWKTQAWLAMIVIGLAGYFLGAVLFNDDSSRTLLLVAITICGVAQVMWGVVQFTSRPDEIFPGIENPSSGSKPFGTFINRNHAADFIALSLGCAVGLCRMCSLSSERNWRSGYGAAGKLHAILSSPHLLSAWLCLTCLAAGLMLTLSRGGWGSTAVAAVAVALVWKRRSKKRPGGIALAAILATVVAAVAMQFFGFGDRLGERVDDMEINHVLSDSRFDHWSDAVPAVRHFLPFGSGQGTYGEAYLAFDPEPSHLWFTHAHNQYLETVMEMGLFGALLIIAGIYFSFRYCRDLCDSNRSASKQALGIACFGAITLHAIHAITEFGLMMPGNLIALAVLVGAATSASERSANAANKRSIRRIRKSPVSDASVDEVDEGKTLGPRALTGPNALLVACSTVLATMSVALWQQGRHASAARLVAETDFTSTTPSPTIQAADEKIAAVTSELERWPSYEPLLRRKIRLHLHQSRRGIYDQAKAQQSAPGEIDPIALWGMTSPESLIARLYEEAGQSDEAKKAAMQALSEDRQLQLAFSGLNQSLQLNPLQPRTHILTALVAACTGQPWKDAFSRSTKLSSANPSQTFGIGLLAWAANLKEPMIQQWRTNLSTSTDSALQIYQLASLRLDESEIIDDLMPDKWLPPCSVAYELAQMSGTEQIRADLLEKSTRIAQATLSDELELSQALGKIATVKNDLSSATEHYAKAIELEPRNARLRYLAALALYRSGKAEQAVRQARVANLLEPGNVGYKQLFVQATLLHRQQYSNISKEVE